MKKNLFWSVTVCALIGFALTGFASCSDADSSSSDGKKGGGSITQSGKGANVTVNGQDIKMIVGSTGSASSSVARERTALLTQVPMTIYLQHGDTVYEASGYKEEASGCFSVSFESDDGIIYQFDGNMKTDGSVENGIFIQKTKTNGDWEVYVEEVEPADVSVDGSAGDFTKGGLPASMQGTFTMGYGDVAICSAFNLSYFDPEFAFAGYSTTSFLSVTKVNDTTYDIIAASPAISAEYEDGELLWFEISPPNLIKTRFQLDGNTMKIWLYTNVPWEEFDYTFANEPGLDDYNGDTSILNGYTLEPESLVTLTRS